MTPEARLVSLTDYCIDHDITPEDGLDAFVDALALGSVLRHPDGVWYVHITGCPIVTLAAYVVDRKGGML